MDIDPDYTESLEDDLPQPPQGKQIDKKAYAALHSGYDIKIDS